MPSIGDPFPSGGIIMWSGAIADIPAGWFLCDGTNGTPNMIDKFIIGAGSTYNPGDTGGEATHTLTSAEIPIHTHSIDTTTINSGGSAASVQNGADAPNGSRTSGSAGSGGAHNNLPPYYALAFIMKT